MSTNVARPANGAWSEPSGFGAAHDNSLSPAQLEAMVRALEASSSVSRRHQFFVWSQSQIHPLLPHDVLVCGAYHHQRRAVMFDVFQSIVLSPSQLAMFGDPRAPLMMALVGAWIEGGGRALSIHASEIERGARADAAALAEGSGIEQMLVHGSTRPMRPNEIESVFVFARRRGAATGFPRHWNQHADLLLPYLHSTWRRVLTVEFELLQPANAAASHDEMRASSFGAPDPARHLTGRERQILQWAREGKNNPQIAEELGISPLTVKNHIQNILRKLGASNRAHAVALVMAQDMRGGGGRR